MPPDSPPPASGLSSLAPPEVEASPELIALSALISKGWSWPWAALPAELEETFYRLNNLPQQLRGAYHGLNERDPDEDIVEEAEPEAEALIAQHYLLDETVDAIYGALRPLPPHLIVRRAGDLNGLEAHGARGALLAIKRLFALDWRVETVMARLAATQSLAIDARPILITPADDSFSETESAKASGELGYPVRVWVATSGELTRALPRLASG